jgi:hypothetical protein
MAYIPEQGGLPMGSPIDYRMPQMGGGMQMPAVTDYFGRGQAMLANADQTMGQMDKAKDRTTTTITEQPPMTAMDMLGAGVGYGLAGMQAYDLYQSWGKDKAGNPYLQGQQGMPPDRQHVLDLFGTSSPASGASPSGGSPILGASTFSAQTAPTTMGGLGGGASSATAMGGRGAHEMLRGGVSSKAGTSTAGLASTGGSAASMAGKMMPVAGAGLAAYGAYSQGQADRQAGGKNAGGFLSGVGSGALSGAMVGSAFGGVGAIPGAIVGGIGGGLMYLLG